MILVLKNYLFIDKNAHFVFNNLPQIRPLLNSNNTPTHATFLVFIIRRCESIKTNSAIRFYGMPSPILAYRNKKKSQFNLASEDTKKRNRAMNK